jgi:FAD/FMN-containing dehydrogenase
MGRVVSSDAVGQLRGDFSGAVLQPGDAGYDEARQVHNGRIDKRPAVIARCQTTADVVDAVRFGRDHGLEVSVRGGGHNVAGRAVTDGGLMIDLAPMKGIYVDPVRRTVRAQGGVTWRELNRAAHVQGLATTGGMVSTTGIAGLTLGAGIGWLMGRYGLAIDNLAGVELVTAAGEVLTVTADTDPDLFWGLRGGGGNFGVAVSLEYRAYPLTTVLGGIVAYPLGEAVPVFNVVRDVAAELPDDCIVAAGLVPAPDGSGQKIIAVAVCHCGEAAQAERDIAPLRSAGTPLVDLIQPMPYPVVNTLLDDAYARGVRNYWRSAFFKDFSDDAVEMMAAAFEKAPSPMSNFILEQFHGAVTRVAPTDTAYPHRQPGWNLIVISEWVEPMDDDANVAWAKETFGAMTSFMVEGAYVNYLGDDETDRVRAAYGPNWPRLVELKRRMDPDNFFRLNQNIDPSAR